MHARNEKLPRLQDEHADKQWLLILTSVEVSLELLQYLLCDKHEDSLSEKVHRVPQQNRFLRKLWSLGALVRALDRFTEEEEDGEIVNLADLRMDCLQGLLATFKIHEKAYKFIVCEFGGFQNCIT